MSRAAIVGVFGALVAWVLGRDRAAAAATTLAPGAFRAALLARALEDVGMREQGGKNRGPEIDRALAEVGQGPGQNWCAALLSRWVRDAAARLGVLPPFVGSAGAKETGERAAKAGKRIEARDMSPETAPPGSIVWWDRSPGEPFSSWEGHIGVIKVWTGPRSWVSVEANSGPTGEECAFMVRTKDDPRLIAAAVIG